MANNGYSTEELKQILGLRCNGSVTDAIRPQMKKCARLYLFDPMKWMQYFLPLVEEVREEMEQERFNSEIGRREAMLNGRPAIATARRS